MALVQRAGHSAGCFGVAYARWLRPQAKFPLCLRQERLLLFLPSRCLSLFRSYVLPRVVVGAGRRPGLQTREVAVLRQAAEGVGIDGDVAVVWVIFLLPEKVMADFLPSRHEVFERFRLCSLSAHDEDGDIGGEAGQASGEPRDIPRDVDDVTTVCILPSLEAVDAHDGGDLGDEHLLNFRHSLQSWGYVSRVNVVVGGEGFWVLLFAVAVFSPVFLRKSKIQKVKSAPHHVVLAPWRSSSVFTF